MPAYSFKERFVPFVLDGSKDRTVRARRKGFAKTGDTLYLYFGMRTKWCKKLREEKCTHATTLRISDARIRIYNRHLTNDEMQLALKDPHHRSLPLSELLPIYQMEYFAWKDGFRPDGSTEKDPRGSFELMIRFWKQTHELPFVGDVQYWKPLKK